MFFVIINQASLLIYTELRLFALFSSSLNVVFDKFIQFIIGQISCSFDSLELRKLGHIIGHESGHDIAVASAEVV